MSFKIVVDSCCELPEEYLQDPRFEIVPLGLEVGDYRIQDDESFDQAEFLKKVAESPQCPRSACPSPEKLSCRTVPVKRSGRTVGPGGYGTGKSGVSCGNPGTLRRDRHYTGRK